MIIALKNEGVLSCQSGIYFAFITFDWYFMLNYSYKVARLTNAFLIIKKYKKHRFSLAISVNLENLNSH